MSTGQTFAVENHPQKAQIIKKFMEGLPLRAVAKDLVPPVSAMALQRYKTRVIIPILTRTARLPANPKREGVTKPPKTDEEELQGVLVTAAEAKERGAPPAESIVRQGVDRLRARLERHADKCETAVRVVKDEEGNDVVVGADLTVLAPIANQLHKNLEMLGKLTGELQPDNQQQINIQVIQCDSDTKGRD